MVKSPFSDNSGQWTEWSCPRGIYALLLDGQLHVNILEAWPGKWATGLSMLLLLAKPKATRQSRLGSPGSEVPLEYLRSVRLPAWSTTFSDRAALPGHRCCSIALLAGIPRSASPPTCDLQCNNVVSMWGNLPSRLANRCRVGLPLSRRYLAFLTRSILANLVGQASHRDIVVQRRLRRCRWLLRGSFIV